MPAMMQAECHQGLESPRPPLSPLVEPKSSNPPPLLPRPYEMPSVPPPRVLGDPPLSTGSALAALVSGSMKWPLNDLPFEVSDSPSAHDTDESTPGTGAFTSSTASMRVTL